MNNNMNNVYVAIEIANPKNFYENDDVYINVKIINKSDEVKFFKISDNKIFSFDFQMVTMNNKSIEHNIEYITAFHRIQNNFYSTIKIEPGEGYLFKARLNDYYKLDTAGQYFIKCNYYPELKVYNYNVESNENIQLTNESINNIITSNQIALNIRPSNIKENIFTEQQSVEIEKKEYATKRPPDEIVSYMLKARMNKEWEKFFLYIDLESIILTNNNFRQRYLKADIERQKQIIKEYKEYLKRDRIDDISFLPTEFHILKTEYTEGVGKVYVLINFKYQDYNEKKYYTYFLNKKGNIWYVTSYEVYNYQ
jgi:hypothetical protein